MARAAPSARAARSARSVPPDLPDRSARKVPPARRDPPASPAPPAHRVPAGPGGNNASSSSCSKGDVNTPSTDVADLDGVKLLASCNGLGRVSLQRRRHQRGAGDHLTPSATGSTSRSCPGSGTANTTAAILLTPASSASSRADVTVHYVSNGQAQSTTINAAAVDLSPDEKPNGLSQAVHRRRHRDDVLEVQPREAPRNRPGTLQGASMPRPPHGLRFPVSPA